MQAVVADLQKSKEQADADRAAFQEELAAMRKDNQEARAEQSCTNALIQQMVEQGLYAGAIG